MHTKHTAQHLNNYRQTAMTLTSWLTSSPEQPTDTTDPNSFASLVNKMNLAAIKADAENSYKEKYLRLRRQVESNTVHNDLRAKITSLLAKKTEYEAKLRDTEKAKTSADMQVVALDLVIKDTNVYYKSKLEIAETQNKALKEENKRLRKDGQDMKSLLLLHEICVPIQGSTNEDTQTLESEFDMELLEGSGFEDDWRTESSDSGTDSTDVCPQWYNYGRCSRDGSDAAEKCELGVHPRLLDFGTILKE
ncbi:uncharacterized protein J4E84_010299 [Alternaria hordeiaustralica]|uniref:uncharacterized protein n=1 Tax=Alternaria hordeiaustralica TaxID=1187925 RepID=UPI0020C1F7B3|nr:uncharacterized protein J4E84_010299 [Alternaria hordeiaustralica]KAI4674858.1 hypothetical protein J4E84_010299 [Alternaria hordeiaustralica]